MGPFPNSKGKARATRGPATSESSKACKPSKSKALTELHDSWLQNTSLTIEMNTSIHDKVHSCSRSSPHTSTDLTQRMLNLEEKFETNMADLGTLLSAVGHLTKLCGKQTDLSEIITTKLETQTSGSQSLQSDASAVSSPSGKQPDLMGPVELENLTARVANLEASWEMNRFCSPEWFAEVLDELKRDVCDVQQVAEKAMNDSQCAHFRCRKLEEINSQLSLQGFEQLNEVQCRDNCTEDLCDQGKPMVQNCMNQHTGDRPDLEDITSRAHVAVVNSVMQPLPRDKQEASDHVALLDACSQSDLEALGEELRANIQKDMHQYLADALAGSLGTLLAECQETLRAEQSLLMSELVTKSGAHAEHLLEQLTCQFYDDRTCLAAAKELAETSHNTRQLFDELSAALTSMEVPGIEIPIAKDSNSNSEVTGQIGSSTGCPSMQLPGMAVPLDTQAKDPSQQGEALPDMPCLQRDQESRDHQEFSQLAPSPREDEDNEGSDSQQDFETVSIRTVSGCSQNRFHVTNQHQSIPDEEVWIGQEWEVTLETLDTMLSPQPKQLQQQPTMTPKQLTHLMSTSQKCNLPSGVSTLIVAGHATPPGVAGHATPPGITGNAASPGGSSSSSKRSLVVHGQYTSKEQGQAQFFPSTL